MSNIYKAVMHRLVEVLIDQSGYFWNDGDQVAEYGSLNRIDVRIYAMFENQNGIYFENFSLENPF